MKQSYHLKNLKKRKRQNCVYIICTLGALRGQRRCQIQWHWNYWLWTLCHGSYRRGAGSLSNWAISPTPKTENILMLCCVLYVYVYAHVCWRHLSMHAHRSHRKAQPALFPSYRLRQGSIGSLHLPPPPYCLRQRLSFHLELTDWPIHPQIYLFLPPSSA